MKHSVKWWVSLLVCAAVFWTGLVSLVMAAMRSDDPASVSLAVRDLTVTAVPSPDSPDDWRDWYEVSYTLENQSDRSLSLETYDLVYTDGGDTLYPWDDGSDAALQARPVLPAGCTAQVCHQLYVSEGESARVSLRYESWDAASDTLATFTLGQE